MVLSTLYNPYPFIIKKNNYSHIFLVIYQRNFAKLENILQIPNGFAANHNIICADQIVCWLQNYHIWNKTQQISHLKQKNFKLKLKKPNLKYFNGLMVRKIPL